MAHDADGRTVEISARTRTIPPALRRALQPTTFSNLVLLCRRHHRSVHEDGFQLERLANGELEFKRPNGWLIPEAPPLTAVPADAEKALRERNAAAGVQVNANTLRSSWSGERFSVTYAIDVMHPRAIGS